MPVNLKSYADTAIGQATVVVNDLRTQAEKAINLAAIKHAVEPYVAQAKGYTAAVTDRAEGLYQSVKGDPRLAKLVTTAETVGGTVVGTVQDRVVTPVRQLTGLGGAPATKPATTKPTTTRPSATKPATTKSAAAATTKPATATSAKATTPRKPAAKGATTRKAPAKKSPTA